MQEIELIGIRAFAREIGVSHAAIGQAIDSGRITAVVHTPRGRKLEREKALRQWNDTRAHRNNNRYGELSGDLRLGTPGELDRGGEELTEETWGAEKTKQEALLLRERHRRLQREVRELEKSLHSREDVADQWLVMTDRIRARLSSLSTEAASRIAKLKKPTAGAVQVVLRELVHAALLDMATGPAVGDNQG